MTAEELEKHILVQRDPNLLVDALAPLDEAQRKKLAKVAVALLKDAKKSQTQDWRRTAQSVSTSAPGRFIEHAAEAQPMAELAALGLCSWTEAKRVSPRPWTQGKVKPGHMEAVLRARRPEWLDKWVEVQLEGNWCDWPMIHRFVRCGFCRKPANDAYIRWMVVGIQGWGAYGEGESLVDLLRKDPELLQDEVWRIFEVDIENGLAEDNWTGRPEDRSWRGTLLTLAGTGELSRSRLLESSLRALQRLAKPGVTKWFCDLLNKLAPTEQERCALQPHYLDLLPNSVPVVVGFALDALKIIAQAGNLDTQRFIDSVGPVFDLRPKSHPITALQVLKRAAKQSPEQAGKITLAATRGLVHPSPEVQKACVDLIDSLANSSNPDLAAALEPMLDSAAPSLRARLQAILERVRPPSANDSQRSPPLGQTPQPADDSDLAARTAEAESIPAPWRILAGIDRCLESIRNGTPLVSLQCDPMAVPRLDPETRLTPIATLDELIEQLSAAVEELDSADQLERLLDGLSRLADQRPDDFAARTAPILKRINDLVDGNRWIGGVDDPQVRLRLLIRAWIQRQFLAAPRLHADPHTQDVQRKSVNGFLSLRMMALSQRLAKAIAAPLLACPTHRGGWIAPRELVERLKIRQATWKQQPFVPIDPLDLNQALLRLAPDGRQEALAEADALEGEEGAAVRFALGGQETRGSSLGVWIAAARARQPAGVFADFAEMPESLGPDTALPALYQWEVRTTKDWRGEQLGIKVTTTPPVRVEQIEMNRPTLILHHQCRNPYAISTLLDIRSAFAIWPANPDATFASGAISMVDRLNNAASSFSPLAPFLDPLFDPATPFSEMGQLMIAIALLVKDPGAKGMAIDALIALINDGRCTGDELGPIYARLSAHKGMVRLNRLAEPLVEIARVSTLHQHAAIRIIQSLLAGLTPPVPDHLYHALTPLREWLIETGEPLCEKARVTLKSIRGSGKSAKLAMALVTLPPGDPSGHRARVYALALQGRIERAQRLMQRTDACVV